MDTDSMKKRKELLASGFLNDPTILASHKTWLDALMEADTWSRPYEFRDAYTANVGFSILSVELADELADQLRGKTVADIGCGTGYISQALRSRGVAVEAFDIYTTKHYRGGEHRPFKALPFVKEFKPVVPYFGAILLSWPDYGSSMAADVIKKMHTGQYLYYCGEGVEGCTADSEFFGILAAKFTIRLQETERLQRRFVGFRSIHDDWSVYKKN